MFRPIHRRRLALLAGATFALAASDTRAATVTGPYVSLGAGYNILQNTAAFFPGNTINPGASART